MASPMPSQWHNFLQNLGAWRGSFSGIRPDGTPLNDTPSLLTLEPGETDAEGAITMVRFGLKRFSGPGPDATPVSEISQEYRSLGRQVVFFDTGSFCKGSLQVAPGTVFGGEFGFIHGDRRHRLVLLYTEAGSPDQLVLIREFRAGSNAVEQPPLEHSQLLGTWRGQAATISADWPEPDHAEASLTVQTGPDGDAQLTTTIAGVTAAFEGRMQWLPDAGYHLSPLQVSHRSPFAVQAGWLPEPDRLECLIRRFDGTGAWQASTQLRLQRV